MTHEQDLRETPAVAAVIAILACLALFISWAYARPEKPPERLKGEIVDFEGYLPGRLGKHVTVASVRLANGRIAPVRWPEGRARHCRKGDHVDLERNGPRLTVLGEGCRRP